MDDLVAQGENRGVRVRGVDAHAPVDDLSVHVRPRTGLPDDDLQSGSEAQTLKAVKLLREQTSDSRAANVRMAAPQPQASSGSFNWF